MYGLEQGKSAAASYIPANVPPPPYSTTSQSLNHTQAPPLRQGDANVFSSSSLTGTRDSATSSSALTLPIVVPQTSKSFKGAFASPFVRAYNRELQRCGISLSDFLTFIDGLNEAWIGSPAFLPFNAAALVMQQCYGVHPVQLAGIGLGVAAGVGSAATSYARVRAYVKVVNETVFHPAGLRVTIKNTKDMMSTVGFPTGQRLALLPPESNQPGNDLDMIEPEIVGRSGTEISPDDPLARRMQALQGYALPLDFDVPEAVSPDNFFKKLGNARSKRLGEKQRKKLDKERKEGEKKFREKSHEADKKTREGQKHVAEVEKKIEKERRKLDKTLSKEKVQREPEKRIKAIQEFEKEEQKLNHELEKEQAKMDKEVRKELKSGEKERGKADRKEEKIANKIRWIVITKWDTDNDDDDPVEEDGD